MRIFVGISGASGMIYGGRLVKGLVDGGHEVTACISEGAIGVLRHEESGTGAEMVAASRDEVTDGFFRRYGIEQRLLAGLVLPASMDSAYSSGSALMDAAVICPCSMSTMASIAAGITRNLIHRVADVMLKEGRRLVLVPRETPLSRVHLQNMLQVQEAGASIVPAMPAFYHNPRTIDDLADFVAGKAMDVLGIEHQMFRRWQGGAG